MAYLMLYGAGGWTQRWQISRGHEEKVRSDISQVGTEGTGYLSVVDSQTETAATLVVAWAQVAAAVIVDSETATDEDAATGQYA